LRCIYFTSFTLVDNESDALRNEAKFLGKEFRIASGRSNSGAKGKKKPARKRAWGDCSENLASHRYRTFAGMTAIRLQFIETKCKLPQIIFNFFKQKHSRLKFLNRFNHVLLVHHKRRTCLRHGGQTIDSVYCLASVLKGGVKVSRSHDVTPLQLHFG